MMEKIKYCECECGCGQETKLITKTHKQNNRIKGEYNKFIIGHNPTKTIFKKGHTHSLKIKEKIKKTLINKKIEPKEKFIGVGEKNGYWKGDNVGYAGLHLWIKKYKPKSQTCEHCNLKKTLDLANISGEYERDINDFKWLCRSCHKKMDNSKRWKKNLFRL